MLRQIFRPIKKVNRWQIRSNMETEQLYSEKDIIYIIRIRKAQWLGHLIRMRNDRNENI